MTTVHEFDQVQRESATSVRITCMHGDHTVVLDDATIADGERALDEHYAEKHQQSEIADPVPQVWCAIHGPACRSGCIR